MFFFFPHVNKAILILCYLLQVHNDAAVFSSPLLLLSATIYRNLILSFHQCQCAKELHGKYFRDLFEEFPECTHQVHILLRIQIFNYGEGQKKKQCAISKVET